MAVALPLLLLVAAVLRLAVNTVIADELHYVAFIRLLREGGDWQSWIWQQHNEHRVIAMKLLMAVLQGPTQWSQRAEMLCSVALTALLVAVLWRIFREQEAADQRSRILLFAPIAWLACSLAQYENQLYGLMVCHYFTVAGGVVALWALSRSRLAWQVLAVVTAVIAATSVASGLLVFPAGLAILGGSRARWSRWLIWCASGVVTIALYFRNYLRPPHAGPLQWTADGLFRVGKQALATLGSPLAANSLAWGLALGSVMALLAIALLARWLRTEPAERAQQAPAAAILIFGLATCGVVALGRAFLLTPGDLLGSRYITHANLAWFGAYFLLVAHRRAAKFAHLYTGVAGLLAVGLLAANLEGLKAAQRWRHDRLLDQYAVQTVALESDGALARLGSAKTVRLQLEYLKQEGLSAFAEPQQLLMPLDLSRAIATADIRRELALEQELDCPVRKLHDAGVLVLPAANAGVAPLQITLSSEGLELARGLVEPASIKAWTWVKIPLARSFDCRGRELTVRVESAAATPGEQLSALSAWRYYEGQFTQGGVEIPDRRLALALNAFHLGLLP